MTLMIKPTFKCQFKCDFCSAGKIQNSFICDPDEIQLLDIIRDMSPDDLIVTGGDPLLKSVDFYKEILDQNNKTKISFTTNLWDFY